MLPIVIHLKNYKKIVATTCFLVTTLICAYSPKILNVTPSLNATYRLLNKAIPLVNPCNITRFPEHIMRREYMQKVASTNWTMVYSAYYDVEKPDVVRIVGGCQKGYPGYFCHLWYRKNGEPTMKMVASNTTVYAKAARKRVVMALNCFIFCPVEEGWSPFAVSVVVGNKCLPANNMLEVTYIGKTNYKRNFTMCLSPFYSNIRIGRLLEWFEFNRILGADNFLLYNLTGRQKLYEGLNYYIKKGLVKIFQWQLPKNGSHNWRLYDDKLQSSAYNDCLLRSKATSRYVVITDFDEFIVPHVKNAKTWIDMLKILPKADAYTFRHCCFPIGKAFIDIEDPKSKEKETAQKYTMFSLLSLKRHKGLFRHGPRSKYFTRTNASFNLMTHKQEGTTAYPVDPKIGFLHHYRKGMSSLGTPMVTDKTVLDKYGQDLASRVSKAWSYMKD